MSERRVTGSYCAIWAETSETQGSIPVAKVKQKMTDLIWLIRSLSDYADNLFRGYHEGRSEKGFERGYMEFHFKTFEDLFNAITVIRKQPVVGEDIYYGTPFSEGKKIKLREVVGGPANKEFMEAVDQHMYFTKSDARENLQKVLDFATGKKNTMVLSVTVCLKGTYATHMHDFLYRNLSWEQEI